MSIAKRALVGALWTSGANYLSQGVGFFSQAALGRLVLTTHFGLFDTADSIIKFIFILTAFSFNISIIQTQDDRPRFFSTAFVLNIFLSAVSIMLTLLTIVGYSFFRALTTLEISVISVLAAVNIANLFGQHFDAILQRNLDFKRISIISFLSNLANPVTAVSLALIGGGVWSIVSGQVVASAIFLFGSWRFARWKISLEYSAETARWFLSQGVKFLWSRSLEVVYDSLDRIVIKSMNSYEQVGIYSRANNIARYPTRIVSPAITNVALPVYARMNTDPARLSEAYGLVNFFLIRVLLPFGLVFLLASETFMTALLGESWAPSGPVLRVLALYAVLFPVVENIRVLFYSVGRPEVVAKVRIVQLVVYIPMLVLLVTTMGILGAAWAVLVSLVVTYAAFLVWLRREITYSLFKTVMIPILVAAATWGIYVVIPHPDIQNRIVSLVFSSAVIFIIFIAGEFLLEGRIIRQHLRFLTSTLKQPSSEELKATSREE